MGTRRFAKCIALVDFGAQFPFVALVNGTFMHAIELAWGNVSRSHNSSAVPPLALIGHALLNQT